MYNTPQRSGLRFRPAGRPAGNDAGRNNLETRLHKGKNLLHPLGQELGRHNDPPRNPEELFKIGKAPPGLIRVCYRLQAGNAALAPVRPRT